MALTFDEVARLALDAGFRADDDSAAIAVAIAKAESGFNPGVMGDVDLGGSIGLWQVHLPSSPQHSAEDLRDPAYNARAAYAISRGGTNFNPWCTYKPSACNGAGNNAYARYLSEARAAVARASKMSTLKVALGVLAIGSLAGGVVYWIGTNGGRRRFKF